MKKIIGLFKKKEDLEEEIKGQPQEEYKEALPSNNREMLSNSTSDYSSKEAKLEEIKRSMLQRRIKKFDDLLDENKCQIDLERLRLLSWNGIPSSDPRYRSLIWKLLLDYLPTDQGMWRETIQRKREEYNDMILHYFGKIQFQSVSEIKDMKELSHNQKVIMKQVQIDVYRTQPEVKIFSSCQIQIMLIRILFVWSMRHPASGYVQGINDLAPPLLLVFLSEHLSDQVKNNIYDIQEKDLAKLSEEQLMSCEADVFWCLSKLIDDIQDNYIDLQPGVHKIIARMKELVVQNQGGTALDHLDELDIKFIDFAYRWVSCYLTREFNIYQIIRLWDTYFAEEDGFSHFHCYVNAALFLSFSKEVQQLNFQDALLLLQNLPTHTWGDEDLQILLAKSYEMKQLH